MTQSKHLKRSYLLLASGWLLAVAYFFVVTLPLTRREREMSEELATAFDRLAAAGHGMNSREVLENIGEIETGIAVFSEITGDQDRWVRFSPEIQELLRSPFQLLDFDYRKFLMIDRIRSRSGEKNVTLFPEWEQRFPLPGSEPPRVLWAQLAMMDQLFRTAIDAGVGSIEEVRLISAGGGEADAALQEAGTDGKITLQMRLTGGMDAIHTLLTMLPLNNEELEKLGLESTVEPKSSFFLDRFILKKNSTEHAGQVSLEFTVNGYLDTAAEEALM